MDEVAPNASQDLERTSPHVALFVTCLVNQFRPSAAFASIKLLEQAGCKVSVPKAQTCCGQPGYNNGLEKEAIKTAKSVIKLLEDHDYVVVPSGSCTGMITKHYPKLFSDDKVWHKKATKLANKTWELCQFLVEKRKAEIIPHIALSGQKITYHDSCSCKRELKNTEAPRQLIQKSCKGASLVELKDTETCCGFGGTFSTKFSDISARLVSDKASDIKDSHANVIVSADLGCLINIAGITARQHIDSLGYTHAYEVRHIAEILADNRDAPSMSYNTTSIITTD